MERVSVSRIHPAIIVMRAPCPGPDILGFSFASRGVLAAALRLLVPEARRMKRLHKRKWLRGAPRSWCSALVHAAGSRAVLSDDG
jgi:hypothetical protein